MRTADPTVKPGEICIGFDVAGSPVSLAIQDLLGHGVTLGQSGAGKTILITALVTSLVRFDPQQPAVLCDPKGDLRDATEFLAALADRLPPDKQKQFLDNVRVVAPFRQPEALDLLAPTGDEPELQAMEIVDALAVGLDSDPSYQRLWPALTTILAVAIRAGLRLGAVPKLLLDAQWRAGVLARLPDSHLKANAGTRIGQLPPSTAQALLARVDRLLLTENLRTTWDGPGCLDWTGRLDRGVTILDVADAPARGLTPLVGGVLLARLVRAVLSRAVTAETKPLWIVIDEVQELLSGRIGEQLGRAYALARHRRAGFMCLFQDFSQVERRSPELGDLIKVNARQVFAFSSVLDSVRWLAPVVPVPAPLTRTRGWSPPSVSTAQRDAAARDALLAITRLPRRTFLWVDRSTGRPGRFLASPMIDLGDVKRRSGAAPAHVRRALALDPRQEAEGLHHAHADLDRPLDPAPPVPPIEVAVSAPREPSPPVAPATVSLASASPADAPPTMVRWPAGFPSLGWTPWSPAPEMPA